MKQHYSILKTFIAILLFPAAYAQGEANIWYFGNKAGIDFSTGNPVTVFNGQLNAVEGCATLSDAQGNLHFYTNGQTVYNKFHIPMANGTGLLGDFSSSQAAVIVQKPGSPNIFYIFTTNPYETDGGFRYSIVDIAANGGWGQVTAKNMLLNNSTCEKISVIRHSNGQDVWVVTHLWNSDAFYAQLVTASGISPVQVTSNAGSVVTADGDHANAIGYMKVSADGKKIVACHTFLSKAELFDFNTATGAVTNPRPITGVGHVYGAEFSPDNNVLYLSAVEEKKIYQFDLNAENVAESKILIASMPQNPGALQIGPDGKIYIAMAENDKLSVINKPNKLGASCNLTVNSIDLEGRMSMLGLPSFNQSFFYSKISADNLCTGSNTGFAFDASFTPTSVSWNFGDATPISNQAAPSHHYTNAGTYTVTVTASYPGGSITRTKEIVVKPAPVASPIATQTFCIDTAESYQLSSNNAALLNGQTASDFNITYFSSMADAQNFVNPLADNYTLTAGSVTIFANIKSLVGGCSAIVPFTITAYEKPVSVTVHDMTVCDGLIRDGHAQFDLDSQTDDILAGQPANCTVKYYLSQEDAENQHNPIYGTFISQANEQIIYARITGAGGCHTVVAFRVFVDKCTSIDDYDIFPKFFTPNGDGYNDVWQTKASIGTPQYKIQIFDRYGRLLKTITDSDNNWDGSFGGRALPSDDYWFVLSGENIEEYRGHFSLKR